MLYRLFIQHKTKEEKVTEFECTYEIQVNDFINLGGREFLVKKRRFDIADKKAAFVDLLTSELII